MIGRPQDIFPSLVPLRLALVFTVISLLSIVMANRRNTFRELFESGESKKYAFFYFIMICGIPFAYHRREAFNYIFLYYLSNMLFFYIFLVQVDSLKKLKSIIFTICLSIFFYSISSLSKGSFSGERFYFGTMYDPNDLAYFFISLFPLSILYIVKNEGFLKRIFGIITVGMCVAAILLSGSRGGFLGLIAVFSLFLFTKIGNIKRSFKILLLIGLAIIFAGYSDKINIERYKSLTEISSDYNVRDEEGRLDIWRRGLQLIASNPITGVGVNCFPMAIGYKRAAEGAIPRWQVAHNSFLQVATEVGLIGFVLFISIIIGVLKTFLHTAKTEIISNEVRDVKIISGLFLIGFTGNLVTSFFLTQGYSILFPLFFAFSVVLRKFLKTFSNNIPSTHEA